MGMSGDTALALAKSYVKKTLQGQGALKGQDGFSPIIEENADNTDKVYKLDITTADSAFTTPNLRGKDGEGSGGGEANVIESISVNGTPISVDENKNVDITVPSIDGLAKTEDIPTKVSELTNDSGYLTEHQDISGKVDKVEGKSLVSDTEIARLASVDNYDDTEVKGSIAELSSNLSVIGKCKNLLNATLQTTTKNGVTCTANGNGTYTLNGTATAEVLFSLVNIRSECFTLYKRIVGKNVLFLNGGHKYNSKYRIRFNVSNSNYTKWGTEKYDGDSFVVPSGYDLAAVDICINSGTTVNNLVVKPMITFDLDATNDDFVPYTGDGETLASDVAEIKKDLGGLTFSASGTTLTITDGTNTWTLGAN